MKVTIQAFSSSGGSYPVEFSDATGVLQVFCHCQVGVLQRICKHKLALLKGERKMLFDQSEEHLLQQVLASNAYRALKPRLEEYEDELSSVEREMAKLKEREKAIKTNFAYELTFGMKKK